MARDHNVIVTEDGENITARAIHIANRRAGEHYAKTGETPRVECADGGDAGLLTVRLHPSEKPATYHHGDSLDTRLVARWMRKGDEVALLDLEEGRELHGPTTDPVFDPRRSVPDAEEVRGRLG